MEVPLPALETVDSYFPQNPKPAPLPYPIKDSTRSFWLNSSPGCNILADEGKSCELPQESDVIIIGSGISGICTLFHLVQELRSSLRSVSSITALEARHFCSGATGRNGGHCTAYNPCEFDSLQQKFGLEDTLKHIELEQRSVDFVIRLIEQYGWKEEVDFVPGGNIHLISTVEERQALERNLNAARQAGVDVSKFRWLSERECSKLVESNERLSGLQIPGTNLYPMKLITKIFQLAKKQATSIGVDVGLYTHTPVNSVTEASAQTWNIETPRGSIKARQVVHATNAYASHLLPDLCTGPHKIVPCRGQVVAVRPESIEKSFWTSGFSYNEGFEYFFQRPPHGADGKDQVPYVILGGGRSVAPAPYELDIADDTSLQPQVSTYLHDFLPHHFPALFSKNKKVQVDFEWSGIMGFTESRNPFIGPVYHSGEKKKGQWLLAGYSGHGMSRAPACAEAIAKMVVAEFEKKPVPDIGWLPSHFLTRP